MRWTSTAPDAGSYTRDLRSRSCSGGKAKQIFYSTGPQRSQADVDAEAHSKLLKLGINPDDVVVVLCIELLSQWTAAMKRFTDAIDTDPVSSGAYQTAC